MIRSRGYKAALCTITKLEKNNNISTKMSFHLFILYPLLLEVDQHSCDLVEVKALQMT